MTLLDFKSLHSLFEEQYKDLVDTINEIVEQIKCLRQKVPSSFKCYLDLISNSLHYEDSDLTNLNSTLIKEQDLAIKALKANIAIIEYLIIKEYTTCE